MIAAVFISINMLLLQAAYLCLKIYFVFFLFFIVLI